MSKLIRSDIQGLRGIAISLVIIFHYWPNFLSGGYIGVDVFFVISGFLITKIILNEVKSGAYTVLSFYVRRVKRIIPALYFVLLFCLIAGFLLSPPNMYLESVKNVLATMLFVANINLYRSVDYFSSTSEMNPLLHMWSLAVEEQYYIFLPMIILSLKKRLNLVFFVILIGMAASLVTSIYLTKYNASAAYFLLPARAHELFIGSLAAYLSINRIAWVDIIVDKVGGVAIFFIFAPAVIFSGKTNFPGFLALIPCFAAAVVLLNDKGNVGRKILCHPVLVYFGGISYSLYLWHWPLLAFWKQVDVIQSYALLAKPCLFLLSIFFAHISYKFIEKPIIASKQSPSAVMKKFAFLSIIIIVGAAGVVNADGFPGRYTKLETEFLGAREDYSPHRAKCHSDIYTRLEYKSNCIFGARNIDPDVAIWGDSHGTEISVALGEKLAAQHRAVMQITSSACPPAIGLEVVDRPYCKGHNESTVANLSKDDRIKSVLLVMNSERYPRDDLVAAIKSTAGILRQNGKNVILIRQVPVFDFEPPLALAQALHFGFSSDDIGLPRTIYNDRFSSWNDALTKIAGETGSFIYDPAVLLCNSNLCPMINEKKIIRYFNKSHLSMGGSEELAQDLLMVLPSL